MLRLIYGIIFVLALAAGAFIAAIYAGLVPANADAKPSPIERWFARTTLKATVARETKGMSDPLPQSDDNALAGVKSYGTNCAMCHGASDAEPSNPAKGFYAGSPMLAKDGVEDDPETETFWKIKHGIRYTAMPAFGATLSDTEIWQLAQFLKHMDKLPPAVDAEWKKMPSVANSPSPQTSPAAVESPSPAQSPSAAESPPADQTPSPVETTSV